MEAERWREGCPLCGSSVWSEKAELAFHLVQCGVEYLKSVGATVVLPSGGKAKESLHDEAQDDDEEEQDVTTKKRKRATAKVVLAEAEEEAEDESEEQMEQVETHTTRKKTSSTTKRVSFKSEVEYDDFLVSEKEGRFRRVGAWSGSMSKGIDHECCDPECARKWKPSPSQVLADDYYCPSCVLHHRNNEDRFAIPRLEWTRHVPNTLYVFSLVDPRTKKKLIKFGRTQHMDAWKRYPAKERKAYKMELLLCLRGKLEVTTQIENWWKSQASEHGHFTRFSVAEFHGKDECVELTPELLEEMLDTSRNMLASSS